MCRLLSHICLTICWLALFSSTSYAQEKLDLNDVSWLWPVPKTDGDLSRIIALDDLKSADGQDVWGDSQFQDLLKAIDTGLTEVNGDEVEFQDEIRKKLVWRIAGMRVDPSAPGANDEVRKVFGAKTQIRLIVQPVTQDGSGVVEVHDVAVHLVYSWTKGKDQAGRHKSDDDKFKEILSDLDALKKTCETNGASTTGKPLGVHPGLLANVTGLDSQIKGFLQKHLSSKQLDSMALMGIQTPEPWIFLALSRLPDGRFGKIPIPIPAAEPQMIDFRGGATVRPTPIVNNRSPVTGPIVPTEERRGVATDVLFKRGLDLDAFAKIGTDAAGNDVLDTEVRNRDISDVVANPLSSHFFNTDCVSCHSETRRRMRLGLAQGDFAFKPDGKAPEIAADAHPKDDWNVRNFGWFPPHFFIGGGPTVATATQRTANETAEVLEFIEKNFRSVPQ